MKGLVSGSLGVVALFDMGYTGHGFIASLELGYVVYLIPVQHEDVANAASKRHYPVASTSIGLPKSKMRTWTNTFLTEGFIAVKDKCVHFLSPVRVHLHLQKAESSIFN